MCAHQRQRCSPTKDGSREEDEDDEVEEVGSPRKRKRASMDEGSQDKKGKRKMTEVDWEAETRWRDRVEARLESMDSVLRKIAVCLEGIEEMMEDRWCQRTPQSTSHYSRLLRQSPIHPSTQTTEPPPAARDSTVV